MAGSLDFSGIKKFRDNMATLSKVQTERFMTETAKELGDRLLRDVKKRTPVYKRIPGDANAHTGGALRDAWDVSKVTKGGGAYQVQVSNPLEYASYAEYGHRGVYVPELGKTLYLNTRFTPGKYMLSGAETDITREAPGIINRRLSAFVRDLHVT